MAPIFCCTLRKRLPGAIPALTAAAPSGLSLRERRPDSILEYLIETHDLDIPLNTGKPTEHEHSLRVLLLSPSAATRDALPTTLSRAQRLITLTGGRAIAAVFLLAASPSTDVGLQPHREPSELRKGEDASYHDSLIAYATLAAALRQHAELSALPLVPCRLPAALPELLTSYVRVLARVSQSWTHSPALNPRHDLPVGRLEPNGKDVSRNSRMTTPTTPPMTTRAVATASTLEHAATGNTQTALDLLLPLCAVGRPLSRQTVYVLTDVLPNLRSVAATFSQLNTSSSIASHDAVAADELFLPDKIARLKLLESLVGRDEVARITRFWETNQVLQ